MEIVETPVGDIKPYKKNARKHSDEQVADIAASIDHFGFNQPLVLDDTGTILVGHGRFLAAQLLQMETVPAVHLGHLTESEKKAYRILDNKLQDDSDWNMETLAGEVAALQEDDYDIEEWDLAGFLPNPEDLEYDENHLAEKAESYLNNTVRQIVLFYDQEQHAEVVEKLNAVGEAIGATDDNSTVVLHLLKFYEESNK